MENGQFEDQENDENSQVYLRGISALICPRGTFTAVKDACCRVLTLYHFEI